MADATPPLNPQPDSSIISPDQLGALQHASRWAGTFGGQDTNIVQRARHNQDINEYAAGLAAKRAEEQARLLQTNQTAQNLWLNTQKLQLQQEQHAMHMQVQAAQLLATGATERRKAAEAMAQATDTAGLNQHVADMIASGIKPQSPEWQAGLANGMVQFSHAHPTDISKFGASLFPGQKLTPEEYIAAAVKLKGQAAAAGFQNPTIREYQGNPNVVEGTVAHTQDPRLRLGHLESLRSKATDKNIVDYLDKEILAAHTEMEDAKTAAKVDLAKRALADPAADPAHKAAARKILGIPDGQ